VCKQLSKKKGEANGQPSARVFVASAFILKSQSEVLQVAIEIDHDRTKLSLLWSETRFVALVLTSSYIRQKFCLPIRQTRSRCHVLDGDVPVGPS
jgi:hypothetical protein